MRRTRLLPACLLATALAPAQSPGTFQPSREGVELAHRLAAKLSSGQDNAFEGVVTVEGWKSGGTPRLLSQAKVALASGSEGRFALRLEPAGKPAYQLASDGQKSWAYVPSLKQYTETEAASVESGESDDSSDAPAGSDERDFAEVFSRSLVSDIARELGGFEFAGLDSKSASTYQRKTIDLPVLQLVSHADGAGGRTVTRIAIDPPSLRVAQFLVGHIVVEKGERLLVRVILDCTSFRAGEKLPDSTFAFTPPSKTKLVDAVPIPGQTGSFLVNQPAPDFDAKTLDGDRMRLSQLRGRPVLLSFWASWCGPAGANCRKSRSYMPGTRTRRWWCSGSMTRASPPLPNSWTGSASRSLPSTIPAASCTAPTGSTPSRRYS
jgi:outer membrane lipoprotein-sorting protein